jgi:hypothetical protein
MNYYIACFFLIVVLCGCENKTDNSVEIRTFPEIISLEGQPINDITVLSRGNVALCVIDTFLVIQTGEEKILKIYGTSTHNLLAEYGDSGEGPEEFMRPVLVKQVKYDSENKSPIITVYDIARRRVNFINILNLISKKGVIHEQKPLPKGDSYMLHFYFINDDFLLAKPEGEGRFFHYDYGSGETKIIPYLPKIDFPIKDEYLYPIFRSFVSVNMDKGLIAAAPMLLGGIDFFDLNGNYLRSTIFDSTEKLANTLTIAEDTGIFNPFHYISDIDAKGEFIYGLNYNNLSTDIYDHGNNSNLKVEVFDWEGNPIKEYILNDNRFIETLAVDLKNNRIYGYCRDERDSNIIIYNMK